jgi:hypothetical protein
MSRSHSPGTQQETPTEAFRRGERTGHLLLHRGQPVPRLAGGPYAVGVLYGFRAAEMGRSPSTTPSANHPIGHR